MPKAAEGKQMLIIRSKKPTVTVKPTSTAMATSTPVTTPTATIAPTATAVVSTPSASPVVSATAIPTATVSSSIVPEATEVVTVEPTATTAVKTPEPTTTVVVESIEPTATVVVASIEPTVTTAVTTPEPTTTVTSTEPITTLKPTVTPVTTPITVSASGISMTLDGYEDGKLTYTIENQSDDDMQYNYGYSIEKENNGEWVQVEPDRMINMPTVILDLSSGSKVSETESIKEAYDLEQGSYRLVKILYSKNCKCLTTLKLPFEVTNTIVYNSGVVMTLDNYADGVISFTIENKYNDEIKYSRDDYTLQKESNGEWIILEPAREFLVRKECVTLNRKERDTQTVNLALGYDLEPGNYRFVKSFAEQGEIALPFEVTKENTKVTPVIVSQSAVSVVLGGYDNGALTYMITNQTGKKIRYSYEAIGKEFNNGELGLIKLLVPETDGTDGEVEADMTKKNKVQLDLPSGNYYYFITITIEESDGAATQEFTLQVPFEVK